jgi:hypothetical protein
MRGESRQQWRRRSNSEIVDATSAVPASIRTSTAPESDVTVLCDGSYMTTRDAAAMRDTHYQNYHSRTHLTIALIMGALHYRINPYSYAFEPIVYWPANPCCSRRGLLRHSGAKPEPREFSWCVSTGLLETCAFVFYCLRASRTLRSRHRLDPQFGQRSYWDLPTSVGPRLRVLDHSSSKRLL